VPDATQISLAIEDVVADDVFVVSLFALPLVWPTTVRQDVEDAAAYRKHV
jgi:hypothetical protein